MEIKKNEICSYCNYDSIYKEADDLRKEYYGNGHRLLKHKNTPEDLHIYNKRLEEINNKKYKDCIELYLNEDEYYCNIHLYICKDCLNRFIEEFNHG